MVTVLTDQDVDARVSMKEAVEAIERALARKREGAFLTPPRHYMATRKGALVFTIGGDAAEGAAGFRVYGAFAGASEDDQLVVVYDASSGALRGVVKGARVGAMRTGALGGIAVKLGAREDASVVAVVGSGRQARTQLEAAAVVRELSEARVYSRSAEKREAFAREMGDRLRLPITAVASPGDAIGAADIVIVATDSTRPVFDGALIEPGQHVTTIRLGKETHELDAGVAARAGAIFTDSMEQLTNYPGGFFLEERLDNITELSEHVGGGAPIRSSADEVTLYLSTGLSGTEVVVADLALRKGSV